MTAFTERAVIIVPLAQRVASRLIAKLVDAGGDASFVVPLSVTGNPPATHFWVSWQMTGGDRARIEQNIGTVLAAGGRIFWLNHFDPILARPNPDEILAQVGLQRILPPAGTV